MQNLKQLNVDRYEAPLPNYCYDAIPAPYQSWESTAPQLLMLFTMIFLCAQILIMQWQGDQTPSFRWAF